MPENHPTADKIDQVVEACRKYGQTSIIALAGVPGTGKTLIGGLAARKIASDPLMVRELQFHQSSSYEEFVEGLRFGEGGQIIERKGSFLEWNDAAAADPGRTYVLLLEEFTRANISSVMGELLTYVEHRDRPFTLTYSRRLTKISDNLVIIATYNPTDRSALDLDSALLRRLRVVSFPPSVGQLSEMLAGRLPEHVIKAVANVFEACEKEHGEEYEMSMPFGHGMFSEVKDENPDLYELWHERIKHLLKRPLLDPHAFTNTITEAYPWKEKGFSLPLP